MAAAPFPGTRKLNYTHHKIKDLMLKNWEGAEETSYNHKLLFFNVCF